MAPSRASRARRTTSRRRSAFAALTIAVLGLLLPGTAYLAARRTKLGSTLIVLSLALYGGAAYVGLRKRDAVIGWALDPALLLWMIVGLVAVALTWIVVLITSYKMLRPLTAGPGSRLLGALVVGAVCFALTVSSATGAQTLMAQRGLVKKVFGGTKSQTRPTIVAKKDLWQQLPRLNILLLGADDGPGRDDTRTDTVMVASIDTKTGNTSLISLTRNFMRMPFPAGSKLHEKFPTGFWDPNGEKEQSEYYLDAMYRNVPKLCPDCLGPSDNKGADVLKLSVGEALGLQIHYYVQVNLAGFAQLVENAASPLTALLIGPLAEAVFMPYMTDGRGADMIGSWFGTGPERGLALLFTLAGVLGFAATAVAWASRSYRRLSAEWAAGVAHCLTGLSEGWLTVPIEGVYPLAQAADMHRRLESRQVAGKLLLKT